MPRLLLAALAMLSLYVFAGCRDAPPAAPAEEQVLTLLYWQAPSLPGPYLASGYKDQDAGAITLEPLAGYDPDGNLVPRLAVGIPTIANGGVAAARTCDAEYDALFEQLARTPIGPDRDALVRRLNDILVQNYYEIPLVVRGSVSAHLDTLRGVRINGWDSELWNIAEWRR